MLNLVVHKLTIRHSPRTVWEPPPNSDQC